MMFMTLTAELGFVIGGAGLVVKPLIVEGLLLATLKTTTSKDD